MYGAARTCHGEEKRAVPCGPSGDPSSHLPANYPDALLVVTAPLHWSPFVGRPVESSPSSPARLAIRPCHRAVPG